MSANSKLDHAIRERIEATGEKHALARHNVLASFNTVVARFDRVVGNGPGAVHLLLEPTSGGLSVSRDAAPLGKVPGKAEGGRVYVRDGEYPLAGGWGVRFEGEHEEPNAQAGLEGGGRTGGGMHLLPPSGRGPVAFDGRRFATESVYFRTDGSCSGTGQSSNGPSTQGQLERIGRLPADHPERRALLRGVSDWMAEHDRSSGFGLTESRVPEAFGAVLSGPDRASTHDKSEGAKMPCTACEALPGQSSSVQPHSALVHVGDTDLNLGIAGHDTGETYKCNTCGSYLYRHTGRLDARVWSWASSPEEEEATAATPLFDLPGVRAALEPLGFTVDEAKLPWGTIPRAWKQLTGTAFHPGWSGRPAFRRPVCVSFSFPSGIVGDDNITLGVTRDGGPGDFSGLTFLFRDLPHLQAQAANVVPYFEANLAYFLCPRCGGLKTRKTRRRDRKPFFGCEHFENPVGDCRWASDEEPSQLWPG